MDGEQQLEAPVAAPEEALAEQQPVDGEEPGEEEFAPGEEEMEMPPEQQ